MARSNCQAMHYFNRSMKLRFSYCAYYNLATRGYVQLTNNSVANQKVSTKYLAKPSIPTFHASTCPPKCWRCNFPHKSELFCSKCKALQEPPENLNYFQIMGINEDYDLKITDIHDKYRQLQNSLHPDRFSNGTEREMKLSENISSLVNKAYSTLSSPLKRGLYMLQLHNVEIPEGTTTCNHEFLMDIMEKNEEVEAASTDAGKLLELIRENQETLREYSKEVSGAFRQKDVERAKTVLVKMKYYVSIGDKLKALKWDRH